METPRHRRKLARLGHALAASIEQHVALQGQGRPRHRQLHLGEGLLCDGIHVTCASFQTSPYKHVVYVPYNSYAVHNPVEQAITAPETLECAKLEWLPCLQALNQLVRS